MARWSIRPSTFGRSIVCTSERASCPDGDWIKASPRISVPAITLIGGLFDSSRDDREGIECHHRIRLRPQTDFPCVLERLIVRVQHVVAIVSDDEMVAGRDDAKRVPDV